MFCLISSSLYKGLSFEMVSRSGSGGYAVMVKTTDRCSQCAVSKHVRGRLNGRKNVVEKGAQAPGITITSRGLWNQNPFKNVADVHEEWTAPLSHIQDMSNNWMSLVSSRSRTRGTRGVLNLRLWSLEEEWRSTGSELCEQECSFHSHWWFKGAVSSVGAGGLSRSNVSAAENLRLKMMMQDNGPNNAKALQTSITAAVAPIGTQNL